jgi:aspartate/glutamate racemase
MGPAATADLMMKIIDMTAADTDQEHIPAGRLQYQDT